MEAVIASVLKLFNETLSAAIVVIAVSMLLYNLTRNRFDRVARTSAVVLGCVTVGYVTDVFVSLGPSLTTFEAALRLQWIGIAYMPVALYHLSDALLATTGLPSRGRRRRVIRLLYILGTIFLLTAAFTDVLIDPVRVLPQYFSDGAFVSPRAGPVFPVYVAYFVIVTGFAFYNVQRARQRCLTRDTRRRMGYLQIAMLTPAVGSFPFAVVLGPGQEFTLLGLFLVIISNIIIILMLLFLAYPLSFFGSRIPDRVVKAELMRFMLRGPATGLLALVTILFTTSATRILGLRGGEFMPFAVVTVVLLWQWLVHLALPYLEKRLVYGGEDYERMSKLQNLSERLLTRTDLMQLLEATLESACNYLRVNTAFVVSMNEPNGSGETAPELVTAIGPSRPNAALLKDDADALAELFNGGEPEMLALGKWQGYWVVPLYSSRRGGELQPIGFLGIQARASEIDLDEDEREMLGTFERRAAQTLDDMTLQTEIVNALEGLLPQISMTRASAAALEFSPPRQPLPEPVVPDAEQFMEQVKAALKDYWGGPGLSNSRLLELGVVRDALVDNDDNPIRALRAVLVRAIERQRPEGDRKLTSPEWTLYNILDLRFMQKIKVRDVAARLALSEPDLYRKQRAAIEAVANTLTEMEQARSRTLEPTPER